MNNFPDNDPSAIEKHSSSQKKQAYPPTQGSRYTGPTPNSASKSGISLTVHDRMRMYEQHYKKLREFVIEGLSQIRDELLPLLYYCYLRLYMKILSEKLPRDPLRKWRNDFINVEQYMTQLAYLDKLSQAPTDSEIKENQFLSQIFGPKTIELSQFAFESLFLFIQKNNFQELDFDVIQSMKINFKITTNNSNKKSVNPSSFLVPSNQILRLTEPSAKLGIRKDEALYMHMLQSFHETIKNKDKEISKDVLLRSIPAFQMNLQEEKTLPLPERNLKYQVDFARSFLSAPLLEKGEEPNILHISVKDPEEIVTCVEIESQGNIMLIGFNNAKILMVVLNSKFKEEVDSLEEHKQKSFEEVTKSLEIDPVRFEKDDNSEQEDDQEMREENEEGNGFFDDEEQSIEGDKLYKRKPKKDKYEIIEFLGHEDSITSLNVQYDELYFLSSSADTTIRLWCIRRRYCLGIFKSHINTVWTTKFASRGTFFASGSSDTTARLWVTGHPVAIRAFHGHTSDVHLVEFSRDCNHLVTGSYDRTIRIWDLNSAKCLKILFPGIPIPSSLSLNFHSDLMLSGQDDGSVILWDLNNDLKLCKFRLNNNRERVNNVGFSPDGKFAVASSGKRISYYEVARLKQNKRDQAKQEDVENQNGVGEKRNNKQGEEIPPVNSAMFEEGSLDYVFISAKFSSGNFIYVISRGPE